MTASGTVVAHMRSHLHRAERYLAGVLACVGGVAFLLLFITVCANAATRAVGLPIRGAVESSGLFCALTAALAMGYAQTHGNHIGGGVLSGRLPALLRRVLDGMAALLGAAIYSMAAYELYDLAQFSLETGETIDGVGTLYPWLIMLTVPGFAGLALIMIITAVIGEYKEEAQCPKR